jgi:hypothetical protein
MPPLDLGYSHELERELPYIADGLMVTIALLFRRLYPDLKQPQTRMGPARCGFRRRVVTGGGYAD